jgi:hypothetical protein
MGKLKNPLRINIKFKNKNRYNNFEDLLLIISISFLCLINKIKPKTNNISAK